MIFKQKNKKKVLYKGRASDSWDFLKTFLGILLIDNLILDVSIGSLEKEDAEFYFLL